jgi:Zn finger protein HypA/HybF involved in hydrogenase expression
MFQCRDCLHIFEEPHEDTVTFQRISGPETVDALVCPRCGSERFSALPDEDWRDR